MKKKVWISLGVFLMGIVTAVVVCFPKEEVEVDNLYPEVSQTDMVQNCDLIVKGRFVSCGEPYTITIGESATSDNGLAMYEYTRMRFEITEVVSGQPYNGEYIDVRVETLTGAQEKFGVASAADAGAASKVKLASGEAVLTNGTEEYLLFLVSQSKDAPTKEEGDYYLPFQGENGFFTLSDGKWENEHTAETFDAANLKATIADYLVSE